MSDALVTYSARHSSVTRTRELQSLSEAAIEATSRRFDRYLDRIASSTVPKPPATRGQVTDKFI